MKERQKRIPLGWLIVACIIAIGLIGFLLILLWGDKPWFFALVYLVVASAIAGGGCVAYHHLRIIQGTERAAVLTSLDACWVGDQLTNSRSEFLKFRNGLKSKKDSPKWQKEIINKLQSYKTKKPDMYRKLVSMLDFYETLGYFSATKYILPSDALELYGPSIKDYDRVFRGYILELQRLEEDQTIYENFIWLADELKKKHD